MTTSTSIEKALRDQGILPLFYHDDVQLCLSRVCTLQKAGIRVIEFTNRGPEALTNFKALVDFQKKSDQVLCLGVGTIYTAAQANIYIEAGAQFIVSPIFSLDIALRCAEKNILYIPGCMTPTEVFTASTAGCALVKLFPAHVLGAAYLKSLVELFPAVNFMPTGGIQLDPLVLKSWNQAGAVAIGLGNPLFNGITVEEELTARVKSLLELTATFTK
ncbi:MAG: hypothetical protein RLZZ446_1082 [Bacteroidota bacterium]|jgi:2-dehydro-3-deoxyphosphogluconate aldolase/(4S)-4-hydroxy-2-oxoglutarate aldolase